MTQKELAIQFKNLHNQFFVLPNVWDAGSAVIFEKQGFKALATTSAGIAFSQGLPDGENVSIDELVAAVSKITKRCSLPLSVDMERGYGDTVDEVVESVRKIILAGAVGINIEDGLPDGKLESLDFQIEKIKALVKLKKEMDIPFVINARTCAYWLSVEGDKVQIAIDRCNAFAQAGADCVFVPGPLDEKTIVKLSGRVKSPLNIVLAPQFYDFTRLKEIGIIRLSIGSGAIQTLLGNLVKIAKDLKQDNVDIMISRDLNYSDANKLFE